MSKYSDDTLDDMLENFGADRDEFDSREEAERFVDDCMDNMMS